MLRYERKYLVPNSLMAKIRERVRPFVRPDSHAKCNEEGIFQYTVRSIYFDSPDLRFYKEKTDGVKYRRKFRIRGYDTLQPDSKLVFEIKRKIGNRIKKHRAFIWQRDLDELMATGDVPRFVIRDGKIKDPVTEMGRFFFHLKREQFIPTVLVVYEREAYHGRYDPTVRITFDKCTRSKVYPTLHNLYDSKNLNPLFRNHFIMEIKYFSDEMPLWGRSLVQEFRIKYDAISKYTIGFDVSKYNAILTY